MPPYFPHDSDIDLTEMARLAEGHRFLLVEDEPLLQNLFAQSLSTFFEVTQAADGQAAWELYEAENFSFVLTDLHMPRMSGLTLAHKIRAQSPEQVILAMSIITDEDILAHLHRDRVLFLPKPLNLAQLLRLLFPICQRLNREK
jgi:DNA-binding response OmpR family regulator